MAIGSVSWVEETLDILADDYPWILILGTILVASLLGIGFYFYFWPVISGQAEYSVVPVLQVSGVIYDVSVMRPERLEPDGEREYQFLVEVKQNSVVTATQQITTSIKTSSPFVRVVSDSQDGSIDEESFSVVPLTSEPQKFSHFVSIVVSRPANHTRRLPVEVGLRYENVSYTQTVDLEVDYWSKPIVYLVTGGAFTGFIAFAVRVIRSLLGI